MKKIDYHKRIKLAFEAIVNILELYKRTTPKKVLSIKRIVKAQIINLENLRNK